MKKSIGLISAVMLSTIMFTGCESMSANEQQISTALAAVFGGAAVGSKTQGGSNCIFLSEWTLSGVKY